MLADDTRVVWVWPKRRGSRNHLAAGKGLQTACGRGARLSHGWASDVAPSPERSLCRTCDAAQRDLLRGATPSG